MTKKVSAVVGLLLLLVAGFVVRSRVETSLFTARAEAQAARLAAAAALADAGKAQDAASHERTRADSAEAVAAAHTTRVVETKVEYRTLTLTAPDTCSAVIAAADRVIAEQDTVISSLRTSDAHLRVALDTTSLALSRLVDATRRLSTATAKLESASHPSLLAKLIPHLGFGLGAGVDATGKPNAVAGITLGWTF